MVVLLNKQEIDMPKKAKELSAAEVRRITGPGLHAVGGVAGLHLQNKTSAASSWILRVKVGNKRRDMGLGGYPDVSLAEARRKAAEAKEKIRQGIDPIWLRKAAREALTVDGGYKQETQKMHTEMVRPKEAARLLGISRTMLWRLSETEANFPKKIVFSSRCVGWRISSLLAWLEEKEAA